MKKASDEIFDVKRELLKLNSYRVIHKIKRFFEVKKDLANNF